MPRNLTQYVCLNGVAAALLLCGNAAPGQAAERQLVLLFNTAHVAHEVMAEAQATAAQVLRQAGIEVRWMDCCAALDGRPKIVNCSEHLDKRPLVLQVLNLAGSLTNQRSLGYAAVDSDGGTLTFLYFDRVEKLMANGELLFTFYEAVRMREEVKRRTAAGAAEMAHEMRSSRCLRNRIAFSDCRPHSAQ